MGTAVSVDGTFAMEKGRRLPTTPGARPVLVAGAGVGAAGGAAP